MQMFKLSISSLAVAAALSIPMSFSTFAGDFAKVDAPDEYITVTATRTERHFMESPASVATVSAEDIKRSSSDSVADTLKDIPGIQITDAATPGMKRITLRGESSLRVAILIDGQEITDHSTYGAPLLLDTSMVERVEVIRGTSSVLYGGKALGGVINIITKKGGSEPIQASVSARYHGATNGQQYAASIYGHVSGFDYRLAASDNEHKDRKTPEGDIDDSSFANDSIMFYLAKEHENHTYGINYEQYNLRSEIATGIPNFSLDMPQRDREKFAAFYTYDSDSDVFKRFHIDAYDQSIDRNFVQHMERNIPIRPPMTMDMVIDTNIQEVLDTKGLNSQFNFALNEQHYFIFGIQYTEDELNKATSNKTATTLNMPVPVSMPPTVVESNSIEEASLETKAVYLQDEWRVFDEFVITAGARHYWVDAKLNASSRVGLSPNDNSDQKFIGSLAANYALNDESNIRAVFSQGYHYPTLLQIATGATAAGSYINPNANLAPEESDNVELGFRVYNDRWHIDTTLFYTDAENYITNKDCVATEITCVNPSEDKVFVNADNAQTTGLELSLTYHVNEQFSPYANVTWLSREETYGDFKTKDTGTPEFYGKFGLKYESEHTVFKTYYIDAYLRTASDADVAYANGNSETYDSWSTLNIALGSTFGANEGYSVNMELSNILDEEYSPATETLMAAGRAVMVKLSADF